LKLLAPNVEPPFLLLNANRSTIASAASAIRSVASLAATRGARTLVARGREAVAAEPNAKGSRSFAINAEKRTPCPLSHSRAARYYAVLASRPAAHRIAERDVRTLLTCATRRR